MKLIVQIPCFNEEQTLPGTVRDISRVIEGVDVVEILVIDDGSTDDTTAVAIESGVDHIVRHSRNRGLASAFRTGIDACLRLGADVIVNTDGDNQYVGHDIPRLIEPILRGNADIVIGDRRTADVPHFSRLKKALQAVGSLVVRRLSATDVPDVVSGFRAFSRDTALQLNVVSPFSYTVETIIAAGHGRLAITSIPVSTNGSTRSSRLAKSVPRFIANSTATMVRIYAMYHPLKIFCLIAAVLGLVGVIPILRFLYFVATGNSEGHIQSLVLGAAIVTMGFVAFFFGMIADLISFNRQLAETTLEKVRRMELRIGSLAAKTDESEESSGSNELAYHAQPVALPMSIEVCTVGEPVRPSEVQ